MDEAERQRATREAIALAPKARHTARFGLLAYLSAASYVTAHERDKSEPADEGDGTNVPAGRDD